MDLSGNTTKYIGIGLCAVGLGLGGYAIYSKAKKKGGVSGLLGLNGKKGKKKGKKNCGGGSYCRSYGDTLVLKGL